MKYMIVLLGSTLQMKKTNRQQHLLGSVYIDYLFFLSSDKGKR